MRELILTEENYRESMTQSVLPYLAARETQLWLEREAGKRIFCMRYLADSPVGVVLISHGFTESAEKYQESICYFLQKGYHVYCMEHCGHGHSYRLTQDLSLVHVDTYKRYTADLLFIAETAKRENKALPLFLYAHSMGGGIGLAAAAEAPERFERLVLSAPMLRPLTNPAPWPVAKLIAGVSCALGKGTSYVMGQKPYGGMERYEDSASTSCARFTLYQERRAAEPLYQTSAASYGWLRSAGALNRYLRTEGWKRISSPVLLFQAESDSFVCKPEQDWFIQKLCDRGVAARIVRPAGTKHEVCNCADGRVVTDYWEAVFVFLESGI
ncbi:MAG: alpha/beta hydrolase [Roseburia sp.]|nr:alpha/beta hydrolase [Roseburia sp.]